MPDRAPTPPPATHSPISASLSPISKTANLTRGCPLWGKYLFTVIAAAGTGANRTHVTYWGRMAALWGDRCLNEIHASDIEGMKNVAAASARMTSRMSS
jgi:hypothetical protein